MRKLFQALLADTYSVRDTKVHENGKVSNSKKIKGYTKQTDTYRLSYTYSYIYIYIFFGIESFDSECDMTAIFLNHKTIKEIRTKCRFPLGKSFLFSSVYATVARPVGEKIP